MKSPATLAAALLVLVIAVTPRAHATPFNAFTRAISVNALGGDFESVANVPGTTSRTAQATTFFGPGTTTEGNAQASTVGFFQPFVISPGLVSNLGRANASASVMNIDGGTQADGIATAAAQFVLFVEVIGPLSADVPLDIGWHVEGSHISGGNDFAEIFVLQLNTGDNSSGLIKLDETAVDADRAGVTTIHLNTISGSFSNQLRIELTARCSTSASAALPSQGSCSATADPTFSFPSTFAAASQYQLAFSPNLAPVPEPSTLLLFLAALGFLAARRGVGRATIGVRERYSCLGRAGARGGGRLPLRGATLCGVRSQDESRRPGPSIDTREEGER
jgi:hypothetical protein